MQLQESHTIQRRSKNDTDKSERHIKCLVHEHRNTDLSDGKDNTG